MSQNFKAGKVNMKECLCVLAAFSLLVAGCASVKEANKAAREQALVANPPIEKARIYIVRSWHFPSSMIKFPVSLDKSIRSDSCVTKSRLKTVHYYCADTFEIVETAAGAKTLQKDAYETGILKKNSAGVLGLSSYIYAVVEPGEHVLSPFFFDGHSMDGYPEAEFNPSMVSPGKMKVITDYIVGIKPFKFKTEAGKDYYFALEPDVWVGAKGSKLVQIPDSIGTEKVRNYKLSAVNYLTN